MPATTSIQGIRNFRANLMNLRQRATSEKKYISFCLWDRNASGIRLEKLSKQTSDKPNRNTFSTDRKSILNGWWQIVWQSSGPKRIQNIVPISSYNGGITVYLGFQLRYTSRWCGLFGTLFWRTDAAKKPSGPFGCHSFPNRQLNSSACILELNTVMWYPIQVSH